MNGLVEIGHGAVGVAFIRINQPSGEKGETVLGIESNRLGVIGNSSVIVAFVRVSEASVIIGHSVVLVKSDRFVKVRHCFIIVAGPAGRFRLLYVVARLLFCVFVSASALAVGSLSSRLDCGLFVLLGPLPDVSKGFHYSVFNINP